MSLDGIDTIVFLMLENRSFDHALGYLGTGPAPLAVEGLRDDPDWLGRFANHHAGQAFPLHALDPAAQTIVDPPHDHATIAIQIGTPLQADPGHGMGGFVDSYMTRQPPPDDPSAVMGHYTAEAVPVFDFMARQYCVCDHWFAALPLGTQPNRLMAMGGHSPILNNAAVFLPDLPLAYDWLTARGIAWCAYQWGDFLPFFSLMPRLLSEIAGSLAEGLVEDRGRFRRYAHLRAHWMDDAPMPRVIFVEPEYTDGPHASPNDDHPPTGIARGQGLVADLYETLTANPARWSRTMLIVTYDEHGGFFDHVPPLDIPALAGGVAVATTGVRVPAFVVSPHVAPGVPFTGALDHTSFLQLLADRFDAGRDYSAEVAARQTRLARLADTLGTPRSGSPPPLPTGVAALRAGAAAGPASSGTADSPGAAQTTAGFQGVASRLAAAHPVLLARPGWASLRAALA